MKDNENKPVNPMVQKAVYDIGSWWYICGSCKKPIDIQDNYCRNCGKPIKHEGESE